MACPLPRSIRASSYAVCALVAIAVTVADLAILSERVRRPSSNARPRAILRRRTDGRADGRTDEYERTRRVDGSETYSYYAHSARCLAGNVKQACVTKAPISTGQRRPPRERQVRKGVSDERTAWSRDKSISCRTSSSGPAERNKQNLVRQTAINPRPFFITNSNEWRRQLEPVG